MRKKEANKKASISKSIYKVGLVMIIVLGYAFAMVGPYPSIEKDIESETWHILWEGNIALGAAVLGGMGRHNDVSDIKVES